MSSFSLKILRWFTLKVHASYWMEVWKMEGFRAGGLGVRLEGTEVSAAPQA